MLALAILGLIAALALPRARLGGGPAVLRASAYQAAALLRSDRAAALRLRRTVETVFDGAGRTLRSGVSRDVVTLAGSISAQLDSPVGGFKFYPDGRSSGGVLELATSTARLDLRIDDFTSTVEIRSPADRGG